MVDRGSGPRGVPCEGEEYPVFSIKIAGEAAVDWVSRGFDRLGSTPSHATDVVDAESPEMIFPFQSPPSIPGGTSMTIGPVSLRYKLGATYKVEVLAVRNNGLESIKFSVIMTLLYVSAPISAGPSIS